MISPASVPKHKEVGVGNGDSMKSVWERSLAQSTCCSSPTFLQQRVDYRVDSSKPGSSISMSDGILRSGHAYEIASHSSFKDVQASKPYTRNTTQLFLKSYRDMTGSNRNLEIMDTRSSGSDSRRSDSYYRRLKQPLTAEGNYMSTPFPFSENGHFTLLGTDGRIKGAIAKKHKLLHGTMNFSKIRKKYIGESSSIPGNNEYHMIQCSEKALGSCNNFADITSGDVQQKVSHNSDVRPITHKEVKSHRSTARALFKDDGDNCDSSNPTKTSLNFQERAILTYSEKVKQWIGNGKRFKTSRLWKMDKSIMLRNDSGIDYHNLCTCGEELAVRSHARLPFPINNGNTSLTRLDKFKFQQHFQHKQPDSCRNDVQSLCMCRTISAEYKDTGFFERLDLPQEKIHSGKLEAIGNAVGINGRKRKPDQHIDSDLIDLQKLSSDKNDIIKDDCLTSTSSSDENDSFSLCLSGSTKPKFNELLLASKDSKNLKAIGELELQKNMENANKQSPEAISLTPICQSKSSSPETQSNNAKPEKKFTLDKTLSTRIGEPTTSRAHSSSAEDLVSGVKKPQNSCFSNPPEDSPDLDVNARWVKRLKVHSTHSFALGTKSYKIDDTSSSGRVHKLFTRVLNYSRSDSDVTMAKCLEQQQTDNFCAASSRNADSSVESLKRSYSWVRRWCRNSQRPPQIVSETRVVSRGAHEAQVMLCEPESTKEVLESIEGKQFPSIAAMALMGKATISFRPCEFRRRGPFVVWNTESY